MSVLKSLSALIQVLTAAFNVLKFRFVAGIIMSAIPDSVIKYSPSPSKGSPLSAYSLATWWMAYSKGNTIPKFT